MLGLKSVNYSNLRLNNTQSNLTHKTLQHSIPVLSNPLFTPADLRYNSLNLCNPHLTEQGEK